MKNEHSSAYIRLKSPKTYVNTMFRTENNLSTKCGYDVNKYFSIHILQQKKGRGQVYFKSGVRIKIKCKYGKIIDSNSLFEYNYAVMV